jgi:N-ethylmaleimide reductase
MENDDSPLFTSFQLGPYRLPHRVVMAPMTRNRAGEGSVPTEMNVTYYRQRSSASLIVSEATWVERRGIGYPGVPGIADEEQVEGWRRVTKAVHEEGSRIFLQLWHGGRISHPDLQPDGGRPVAPSAVRPEGEAVTPGGPSPFVEPRALETGEVEELVGVFRRAAQRAYRADFDGVELHAANGYLVDQFLRDGTNRRDDRYGGSADRRCRFLVEVTEALCDVWGPARVGVRLSPVNGFNDMRDSEPAATFGRAAGRLDDLGVGYLHLVEPGAPVPATEGEHGHVFARIREAFTGTLVANGGYDRPSAERAIETGWAGLVSFAADFLATPDLPRRLAEGLPLNEPDRATFYGGDERGYVDYPTWEELDEERRRELAAG